MMYLMYRGVQFGLDIHKQIDFVLSVPFTDESGSVELPQ
jgi:hypothetical protein